MKSDMCGQSEISLWLGPASSFVEVAVFHQYTKQTYTNKSSSGNYRKLVTVCVGKYIEMQHRRVL